MDRIGQQSGNFSPDAVLIGSDGRIELGSGEITIGRELSNTIVVDDPRASRRHAIVRSQDQGHTIIDVGSANGTLINGQRLQINVPYILKNRDTVRIGNTTFTFELVFPPTTIGLATPP
ncbi:MAG TPA: FHA domain-containing protein, partial [Ktedonobacteraceae bacterium]